MLLYHILPPLVFLPVIPPQSAVAVADRVLKAPLPDSLCGVWGTTSCPRVVVNPVGAYQNSTKEEKSRLTGRVFQKKPWVPATFRCLLDPNFLKGGQNDRPCV